MMKKTGRTKKKLDVKPEPIRKLTPEELARVAGGMGSDPCVGDTDRWSCSCNTCGSLCPVHGAKHIDIQ